MIATEHAEEQVTGRIAPADSQVRCSVRQLTAPDPETFRIGGQNEAAGAAFAAAIDSINPSPVTILEER